MVSGDFECKVIVWKWKGNKNSLEKRVEKKVMEMKLVMVVKRKNKVMGVGKKREEANRSWERKRR